MFRLMLDWQLRCARHHLEGIDLNRRRGGNGACVSETAHPATQARIKAAALAANNPVILLI
jgi:hypothetical protein